MLKAEFDAVRADPVGAAQSILLALLVLLIGYGGWLHWQGDPKEPTIRVPKPVELTPPPRWRRSATTRDILKIPGRRVLYWARPGARYSSAPSRRIRGIVVHFPASGPAAADPGHTINLIKYMHRVSLGYHVYVDRDGVVYQGAPLGRRTSHVKGPGSSRRRPSGPGFIRNANSVGISLVGACDVTRTNPGAHKWGCRREYVTPVQLRAAIDAVQALRARFKLPCTAIWGHGELQFDRNEIEGQTVKNAVLAACGSA